MELHCCIPMILQPVRIKRTPCVSWALELSPDVCKLRDMGALGIAIKLWQDIAVDRSMCRSILLRQLKAWEDGSTAYSQLKREETFQGSESLSASPQRSHSDVLPAGETTVPTLASSATQDAASACCSMTDHKVHYTHDRPRTTVEDGSLLQVWL